jgi:probable HAF family extracellular repeat protein
MANSDNGSGIVRGWPLAVLMLSGVASAHAGEPFFMGIGDLAGGGFNSRASDISSDGSVVAGHGSTAAGLEALRWTLAAGAQSIGDLPGGGTSGSALAISHDGTVIVGHGETATAAMQAFRWTDGGGIVGLGFLSTPQSIARGASLDGSIVVGQSGFPEPKLGGTLPFRWTMERGMVSLDSLPGGTTEGVAHDVSADGSVVVGYSSSANGIEAFRWTDPAAGGGGMVGLGDLDGGGSSSAAFAVSADGSVVVGQGFPGSLGHAFRWTQDEGMIDLGTLPAANPTSIAFDVSDDGAIVVGEASSSLSFLALSAFIWSKRDGMQDLHDVLADLELDIAGWILAGATGVSADGRTIVGWGLNPLGQSEGWIAHLGEPLNPADLTGDGIVDAADLAELLAQWGVCDKGAPCTADIAPPPPDGGDGIVDAADLAELLANWT